MRRLMRRIWNSICPGLAKASPGGFRFSICFSFAGVVFAEVLFFDSSIIKENAC